MNQNENELLRLRDKIDEIDGELLRLFARRMDCVRGVAQIKSETGQPVYHAEREHEILERVGSQGGRDGAAARILFANIMDLSRALQQEILHVDSGFRAQLSQAPRELTPALGQAIACQGVPGSFSEAAAQRLFPASPRTFYPQFNDVFSALREGVCALGVLPVENSSAGPVEEVYELLRQYGFYIVGTVEIPIHHCLCGVKGTALPDIRTVVSHPQALKQCAGWLQENGLDTAPYSNTAAAAREVAAQKRPDQAVICSRQAAEEYGLAVLAENIQDETSNRTRFVVVSRVLMIQKGANRISVCFSLPHATGSLYRVLQRFALRGYNLTRIQSAVIPDQPFEYRFFVDFAGDARAQDTANLLSSLRGELISFSFLGTSVAVEER